MPGSAKKTKRTAHKTAGRRASRPKPPFPKQSQPRPGIEAKMTPRPAFMAPEYRGAGRLAGKVALITGGDSGIGRAVAVLYAREGADIAIVYMKAEQQDADETKSAIENEGGRCVLIPGDVRRSEFCARAVEQTVNELGRLDVLVNNAAYQEHQKDIADITDEQLERTFTTNIFGYFYMARAAIPRMKAGAAIINTGSITGLEGSAHLLDYASTKGAIHAFTKSLAQMLVDKKIRVNCVAPGPIWTPLNVADKGAAEVAQHGEDTPMSRPGQPEEVAPSYVFFASNVDSSYITGEVLTLLGGNTTAG
ncbi:MAG TPA: SDR family oxidoreductase [Gemmatimonadaceae bacterium]|jgi:NAD(P)-dependent dehydrogenase (short-subunit alcohol dehydrogenase family)|nr:SDR family oxidoreductase [Gemmatimonadaceae bacterium]